MPTTPARSVLLVGSEAQPFAKSGGLADVLGALPSALSRLGWDATVVGGSSTGELKDATGVGTFEAPHGSRASYELELSLPEH